MKAFPLIIALCLLPSCISLTDKTKDFNHAVLYFGIPSISLLETGRTNERTTVFFHCKAGARGCLNEQEALGVNIGYDVVNEVVEIISVYLELALYSTKLADSLSFLSPAEIYLTAGYVLSKAWGTYMKTSQSGGLQIGVGFSYDFPVPFFFTIYYRASCVRILDSGDYMWAGSDNVVSPFLFLFGFSFKY